MRDLITNSLINKLSPKENRYEVRDSKLTGFILRVNPTGKMVYLCEFKRGRKINIGRADAISPNQARDLARQILFDHAQGNDPHKKLDKPPTTTFKKFIEDTYAPWRIAHRKHGKEDILRLKTHFFELFGNKNINELKNITLEKWRSKRLNNGIHAETINRDVNVLKASLSKAVEWSVITDHPFEKIKPLKFDRRPKVRYLSNEEFLRLSKTISKRQQNRIDRSDYLEEHHFDDCLESLITISLNTGARRGELLTLTWSNVDFDNKLISIIGKSQVLRHVPLNKPALECLTAWKKINEHHNLVFSHANGKIITAVQRKWKAFLEQAEIKDFRWHDMRHHFASKLVMAGVDLNTVRELLGHSDIKMTLRYAHLAPEHKARAVEKLVLIS